MRNIVFLTNACLGIVGIVTLSAVSVIFSSYLYADESELETIRVSVPKYFPPYYMVNKDGVVHGYAIDVAEEIARLAGVRFEYHLTEGWDETIADIKEGRADVIANMGVTPERSEYLAYTIPYETFKLSFITSNERDDIHSVEQLKGKRIGVVSNNAAYEILKNNSDYSLVVVDDLPTLMYNLFADHVDAVVYPETIFIYFSDRAGMSGRVKVLEPALRQVERAMAVRKRNRVLQNRLNIAMNTYLKSDRSAAIYKKWHDIKQPYWTVVKLVWVLIALGALVIIIVIWRSMTVISLNSKMAKVENDRRIAEMATKTKSEFMSKISHKLRTPMNAILGFANLLELDADELTDEQNDNVSEIVMAGRHLLELINKILEISSIESGRYNIQLESIEVSATIDSCVSLVQPMMLGKNIDINVNADSCGYVLASRKSLKQIFLNIISNAVKYNRVDGKVDIYCLRPSKERLSIVVEDTGMGISEDDIKSLFEPFESLDKFSSTGGYGMGLAISRELAELMDGNIEAHSVEGQGAKFIVTLPAIDNT